MNSVEALDSALLVLRNRQRRLRLDNDSRSAEVIETLNALRDLIADSYTPQLTRSEETTTP